MSKRKKQNQKSETAPTVSDYHQGHNDCFELLTNAMRQKAGELFASGRDDAAKAMRDLLAETLDTPIGE